MTKKDKKTEVIEPKLKDLEHRLGEELPNQAVAAGNMTLLSVSYIPEEVRRKLTDPSGDPSDVRLNSDEAGAFAEKLYQDFVGFGERIWGVNYNQLTESGQSRFRKDVAELVGLTPEDLRLNLMKTPIHQLIPSLSQRISKSIIETEAEAIQSDLVGFTRKDNLRDYIVKRFRETEVEDKDGKKKPIHLDTKGLSTGQMYGHFAALAGKGVDRTYVTTHEELDYAKVMSP